MRLARPERHQNDSSRQFLEMDIPGEVAVAESRSRGRDRARDHKCSAVHVQCSVQSSAAQQIQNRRNVNTNRQLRYHGDIACRPYLVPGAPVQIRFGVTQVVPVEHTTETECCKWTLRTCSKYFRRGGRSWKTDIVSESVTWPRLLAHVRRSLVRYPDCGITSAASQ